MTEEFLREMTASVSRLLRSMLTDETFIVAVLRRLETLSYLAKEEDAYPLAFSIVKTESTIKNACNIVSIPDGLRLVAVDMVCGEFLYSKKQTGGLEGFDLETAVKQVQAGDTNVTFAVEKGASVEQRLDALFSYLIGSGKGEFVCYRKIRW